MTPEEREEDGRDGGRFLSGRYVPSWGQSAVGWKSAIAVGAHRYGLYYFPLGCAQIHTENNIGKARAATRRIGSKISEERDVCVIQCGGSRDAQQIRDGDPDRGEKASVSSASEAGEPMVGYVLGYVIVRNAGGSSF